MNIFYVDSDPIIAAQSLIDCHVVKMPIESAQMLSNIFSVEELARKDCPRTQKGEIRRHYNKNNRFCRWALHSQENYDWLWRHAYALCEEFEYRRGKEHYIKNLILWIKDNYPVIGNRGFTIPLLQDVDYRRNLYIKDKRYDKRGKWIFTWTKRNPPGWVNYELRCKVG